MFLKFMSCLLIFGSAFSNSLMDQFKKEVVCWPKKGPGVNKLYKDVRRLKNISSKPKIPKIIHQIWLGGAVPEKFKEAMQSWKLHHPEWTYMLWTDKEVDAFEMENKNLFDLAPNFGMKSDLWRMEILHRYGGLYVDVDQFCIKPHDIFHHAATFYVGKFINHGKEIECNNNVIGISKNHSFAREWIESVRDNFCDENIAEGLKAEGPSLTLRLTGPHFLTKLLKSTNYKDCLVLEKHFFNPLVAMLRTSAGAPHHRSVINIAAVKRQLKKFSYSAHFHTCSWGK